MRPIRIDGNLDPEISKMGAKFEAHTREVIEEAVALGFDPMQVAYMLMSDVWMAEFITRNNFKRQE